VKNLRKYPNWGVGTHSRVGINRANFAVFILDLRNFYQQLHLHNGFTHKYRVVKSTYIIYFWQEIGLFLVCLTVEKNAGMP
jgi:hypothetical protein